MTPGVSSGFRRHHVALACALSACSPSNAPDLAAASTEAQFDSVAKLGPHTFSARIERQESIGSSAPIQRQEGVEIRWESWDAFESRRLVNGEQVSCVRVVDGRAWSQRRDGTWVERGDPEPARQELRLAWNSWEQALEPFDDHVDLTGEASEVVEGRRARRFTVALAAQDPDPSPPPAKAKRRRRRRGDADQRSYLALSGDVVIDEATAVRLLATVRGEWADGERTHTVSLDLSRAGFGLPHALTVPGAAPAPAPSPGNP